MKNKRNVKEYRAIAFKAYGRKCSVCKTRRNLEVHHKDGNSNNNSEENLQVLCTEHHLEIEGIKVKRKNIRSQKGSNGKRAKGTRRCKK